jgi:hypothetical protein
VISVVMNARLTIKDLLERRRAAFGEDGAG